MSNILDVVAADKNLAVLGKGMKAAGLEEVLGKKGPFTVFAPTDLAFSKLAPGQWPDLLKPENKTKLAEIMNHHVVEGKTNFKDFTDGQKLKTVAGKELTVKVVNGAVDIDGARIQGRDMEASNGVVHSLDKLVN
ncbi:MAG TPA: fasciclin domain-containing protein [Chitinophagaceae bacterium]|nr:fasciclin domain-containing protein [Chitinophagaceae bacterium]